MQARIRRLSAVVAAASVAGVILLPAAGSANRDPRAQLNRQSRSLAVSLRRVEPSVPGDMQPDRLGLRTITVQASGYALTGRTASGIPVARGVVAVDPAVIPLGTRMTIPGYGRGVAADIGAAVRGSKIDLWFPTRAKALAWGRRTVTVTLH